MKKERATDERAQRAVVHGGAVTYRGQTYPLGRVKRGVVIPSGKGRLKAQRLRLAELEVDD